MLESISGHLSRRMLEHYSHQRLKAKGQMLARMEQRRNKEKAGGAQKDASAARAIRAASQPPSGTRTVTSCFVFP